jgi:hypothetical protein
MPTDHRLRLDDHEDLFPTRPEPGQRNPEGTIERGELGLPLLLGIRRELLAEGHLHDRLVVSASEEGSRTAKKHRRQIEHSQHRGEILHDSAAEKTD